MRAQPPVLRMTRPLHRTIASFRCPATASRALLLSLLALGCGEPLFPVDVARWYQLQSVGAPPPWTDPSDPTQRLLAADLVLLADRTAVSIIRVEFRSSGSPSTIEEYRTEWLYEFDGTLLTLRTPQCISTPAGGWGCGAVVVERELRALGDRLVGTDGLIYRRVGTVAP